MVYNMVMKQINVAEAKAHFSRYLARVRSGEVIVICHRNEPVAELRPLPPPPKGKRPIGLGAEGVVIHPSFFDPLPEDALRLFEGKCE